MFGRNPVAEDARPASGQVLSVVKGSPFYTLQGEGPHAGEPAIFLRFHGCSLRCTYCDTSFSEPDDPVISLDNLYASVVEKSIHGRGAGSTSLVVLTGGEPCRQNIIPLISKLRYAGFTVQIETAGIYWLPDLDLAEIVCSPKTPRIDPDICARAIAFKYVISASAELDGFLPVAATQPGARPARLAAPRPGAPVYLSPMDEGNREQNILNKKKVAELAMKYGVRAGVQMHKELYIDEPV